MKKNKKQLIFRVLIGSLIIILLNLNGFALISNNGSGSGYDDGDGKGDVKDDGKSITIENYIIEGSGYYLNANSYIQTILKMVELQYKQGIDFIELNKVLDNAIFNINNAIITYDNLIKKAENTPYNEYVIALLKDFDYSNFLIENGLNSVVFEEVEGYLQVGDITGIYISTYRKFTNIHEMLIFIKGEVSKDKLPGISIFWRLNETIAKSSIFGSYIARVFYALQKNK